jgi:hypothetical protein
VNREDVVLRQIAELEELEAQLNNRYELDVSTKNQPLCPVCRGEWHGLKSTFCPGAFATKAEITDYHQYRSSKAPTHIWIGRSFSEVRKMVDQVGAISMVGSDHSVSLGYVQQITQDFSVLLIAGNPLAAMKLVPFTTVRGDDLYLPAF